jgi:NTE family protein
MAGNRVALALGGGGARGYAHIGVINKLRGILDPLPMAPIAAANADVTIAVSLSGSEAGGRYEPTDTEPRATTEWLNRMWRSTTALFGPSHPGRRYPPDLLIEVPRTACRGLELRRAAEVIDVGHELAAAALDLYKSGLARSSS